MAFTPFQVFWLTCPQSLCLATKVDSTWGLTNEARSPGPHGQEKPCKTHHPMDKLLQCWLKIGSI